jgi:cysteine desulfurase/selenocysteine lyase
MPDPIIYLDNAATSFPKAPGVVEAVAECIEHGAGGAGRSFGAAGAAPARVIFETRQRLARLLGHEESADIILTPGATLALNLALNGLVEPGQHVITTSLEHNAVARPLSHLAALGCQVTRIPCPDGLPPEPEAFHRALKTNTAAIAMIHASNVSGAILPMLQVAEIAREAQVPLLVDASQSVGSIPVNIDRDQPDLLAFAGHKGLLGPAGTGGIYVSPAIDLPPLWRGGTGSRGFSADHPTERPDCYESGTPNLPGIAGLGVSVEYLIERGLEAVREHEVRLIEGLIDELGAIPGVVLYGPRSARERSPLVSLNIGDLDPAVVGMHLERDYGIISRCGFHCSAWAHESIGTLDRGAVRLSVSPFTTEDEVAAAARAIAEIAASVR